MSLCWSPVKCRWFSRTGSLCHCPTPGSTASLCSYSTSQERQLKAVSPPPCHRHLPAINPILARQSHRICTGLGELQLLIWSWLVVCDCLPCCCRRTRSSWSQDPSMLLTLTTPSGRGSCTVLLGVSRPCHLPQGTLLMSPVVPAKST